VPGVYCEMLGVPVGTKMEELGTVLKRKTGGAVTTTHATTTATTSGKKIEVKWKGTGAITMQEAKASALRTHREFEEGLRRDRERGARETGAAPSTSPPTPRWKPEPMSTGSDSDDGDDGNSPMTMVDAKLRREIAAANKLEIENAQRMRLLIPVEQVRSVGTKILTELRDLAANLPGELQDELANETHPAEVRRVLEREFGRMIGKLRGMDGLWTAEIETKEVTVEVEERDEGDDEATEDEK
jgi:hypothetical protein